MRQTSNCRGESSGKEAQDGQVHDELPHQARADHAEDGEVYVEVHQLACQHKIEEHREGGHAVVDVHQLALPLAELAAINEQLVADREAMEDGLAAEQTDEAQKQQNFDHLLARLQHVLRYGQAATQACHLLLADRSVGLEPMFGEKLSKAEDVQECPAKDHGIPFGTQWIAWNEGLP